MTEYALIFLLVFAAGMILGYGLRSQVALLRRERGRRNLDARRATGNLK